jgi:Predicted amidophosphoribosyltransferases
LIKVKETKLQVELNKTERFENLKDSFKLTVDKIDGNTLVFDDILTTGATLLEAYKTIKDKVNGNLYAYVITKV